MKLLTILMLWFSLLGAPAALPVPVSVTLAWNANKETNVAGYIVYWGTTSSNYVWTTNVGNQTSITLGGFMVGTTYYFSATAFDQDGLESDFAPEINYTPDGLHTNRVSPASSLKALESQPPRLKPALDLRIGQPVGTARCGGLDRLVVGVGTYRRQRGERPILNRGPLDSLTLLGIKPDLVRVVDPLEQVFDHLEGLLAAPLVGEDEHIEAPRRSYPQTPAGPSCTARARARM